MTNCVQTRLDVQPLSDLRENVSVKESHSAKNDHEEQESHAASPETNRQKEKVLYQSSV